MKRPCVHVAVALMLVASTASPGAQARAGATTGSLCVLPHVERAQATTSSPEVPPAAEHYSLRLDGGAWVPLSAQTAVLLANIPLQGTHKVAIRGDGRPFSAFSFSFTELGRSDLCLSQSGMYLTWRFHPSPAYSGCRCKGITPARWAGVARVAPSSFVLEQTAVSLLPARPIEEVRSVKVSRRYGNIRAIWARVVPAAR